MGWRVGQQEAPERLQAVPVTGKLGGQRREGEKSKKKRGFRDSRGPE